MSASVALIGNAFKHATTGSNVVATQSVLLNRIVVNDPGTTITATIYDGVNTSAPVIAVAKLVADSRLEYGLQTANGLLVVLSGTCDVTIITGQG